MYKQYKQAHEAATRPSRAQGIRFYVNGIEHNVAPDFPPTTSLNDYLREVAGLKGTKVMCREAGCGCCSVTVTNLAPDSDKLETRSIQSCLAPLYSVDGWQISTIEGIGNQRDGFHPIQERIAKFNGTQCGYCTPGMVMNMYGLLHQKPDITAQEIEDNFDGNMCRCTGYRSILDAMKSFAADGDIPGSKCIDIEDLNKNLCPKTGEACTGDHAHKGGTRSLELQVAGGKWYRPTSLEELGSVLRQNKDKKIRLIFGNTAAGIFKDEGPFDVYVDLHRVKYIFSYQASEDNVRFGAGTTLTALMIKLKANQDKAGFKYFAPLLKHFKVIANVMVRNAGSIAGNLMIKHKYQWFPSDIFTTFEAIGAQVEIYDSSNSKFVKYGLMDFLQIDMTSKVISAVVLPKLPENTVFKSFKITPRWQNAHAYVNAAFNIVADERTINGRPALVYGGINAETVHAVKTEDFLTGKTLSNEVVKEALTILKGELNPEADEVHATPKYRQELSVTLLYKVLLGICKPNDSKMNSGPDDLLRPISSGLQTYQEMKSEYPLKKPMPKLTAELQASGDAQYINDIPTFQHELCAAFVLSDVASATLGTIDASEALKAPGVVRFLSAKDIPEGGSNNYMPSFYMFQFQPQEVFATKEISFAGQAIGAILAESQREADAAVKLVKVTYTDVKTPILNIEDSIAQGKEFELPMKEFVVGKPDDVWSSVEKTIEGECRMGSQYHFFLETQISLAVPNEDSIDVHTATQIADMNQQVAAEIIGKPMNFINVTAPRVGGAFGGKTWDSCPMTAVATLGAYLTGRPVRMCLDLSSCMRLGGKRCPVMAKYKVGFSNSGKVEVIEMDYYSEAGYLDSCKGDTIHQMQFLDMGYHVPNWKIRPHAMMTNKQVMSPTRAPGSVPAAFVIETIMEHVAKSLDKHPIIVKEMNLYEKDAAVYDLFGHEMSNCTMKEVWRRLKDVGEVESRVQHVDAFNAENLWKKRGITMCSCKYGMAYFGSGYTALVTIYARDGTVAVTQGGIEMGQGLFTKVAQGVAHILGIPLELIKVKPNQNLISPNSWCTGGSVSSESTMQAAMEAANILKERMAPIREKFPDADWKELCLHCIESKVDLSAKFLNSPNMGNPCFNYFTYCAAVIETELDILTGESQVRRVDLMNDLGESLNPTIDIGQVEGAFVMGLGVMLAEDILFSANTGRILNDGTWEYKPPTTKDIPIDWRVHLLPDTPNPIGIRSSKAVGEPPISMAVGALLANKLAAMSARKDLFNSDDFIPSVAPYTVERAQQSVGLTVDNLTV